MDAAQILLCSVVGAPAAAFLGLSLVWLLGATPGERSIIRVTRCALGVSGAALAALTWLAVRGQGFSVTVPLGNWFSVHEYSFPLVLLLDSFSWPLAGLTILLTALIAVFSATYMHREPGFLRFYLQLNLFATGALLVLTAGSFDLLIGGWELVGISSVLLIAFFEERTGPVRNAIRVFATYRTADLGLLLGVFLLHHWAATANYADLAAGTHLTGGQGTLIGLLLLMAAAGKSAQLPFSGWLARAMEGPTPSSAIFYGAISVHLGAYLLLRAQPMLAASPAAAAGVVIVGGLSALYGTIVGRACSDAKTGLAFAALSQLGLIFVEIGFGWTTLALFHILSHAAVRTLQFLRAPSLLHDFHLLHAASGGPLPKTGEHLENWVPLPVQHWLYRFALDRGHLDSLIDRLFAEPLHALSAWLGDPGRGRFSNRRTPSLPHATKVAGGLD